MLVKKLTNENLNDYERFLKTCETCMFTHSLKYKKILEETLDGINDNYICVYDGDSITAVLPLFLRMEIAEQFTTHYHFMGATVV